MSEQSTLSGDLVLSIPLYDAIDRLSSEDRARILTIVGFDRTFLKDVVSQLTSSVAGKDGDYWFERSFYIELREAIIEQMPTIVRELVIGLIHQRNEAQESARRESDWSWAMYHAWPDGYRRPERPEWEPSSVDNAEREADAILHARDQQP